MIILHYIFNEIISGVIQKSCGHDRCKLVHKRGSGPKMSRNYPHGLWMTPSEQRYKIWRESVEFSCYKNRH